ncbi:MAG: hybrid sensor histidine kinase/response regulator [Candidatus Krumholzibacteriota bacterium]
MTDPKDRTILVVDDSPPTCLYLKRILEKKGYGVVTAADGAIGARLAMELLPDLILLDKEMPGMHGFDVSRILRKHEDTRGIPILMISSESKTSEKIRGLEMGADDFITKGIGAEELHSKIAAFLRIKDLQDKLRLESNKLNQIFRFLHEPVAICSTADEMLLASQVFLNLLRMPREVARFKTMTEILRTLEVPDETIALLREGTQEDVRLTINVDEEEVFLTARTAPIQLEEGESATAYTFRDITREVAAERIKADFHSMIAHDLRSPMSVIQGYVSLMATGKTGDINDTQKEFLGSVNRKITEMTALLNDFLDISKIDAGFVNLKCRDMDLGELVTDVVADLEPMAASSDVSLDVAMPAENVTVFADPLRLTQIFRNLVSNAIKYNVESGWIRLTVVPRDGWAQVSISDGGIGMAPEELAVLFEPYTRGSTQRKIRGVGLGVVIVKKLVESHGGEVTVTSVPGKGSTFTFTIPMTTAALDAADDAASGPEIAPDLQDSLN